MKKTISPTTFIKRVNDTIKYYDMLSGEDKVLVGVSGGSDSVCLLKVLLGLRKKLEIDIVVANLDHGIRGRESKRDSNFVKSLAEKMDLKYVHKKIKISSSKKNKKSIEEKAREARYSFFIKEAKKNKCKVIATGHNLDDQAETVLMRLVSGSSFKGLTGIPPVRIQSGIKIVRPLIRTEKKDILDFLKKEKIKYVTDSTNLEEKYLRNSVRLKIIPFLEEYNPQLKRSLANLADGLREDFTYLKKRKSEKAKSIRKTGEKVSISISDILLQPRSVRKDILKEAIIRIKGNVKKLTYRHWMEMDLVIRSGVRGKSLDLPGNIRMTRTQKSLELKKREI